MTPWESVRPQDIAFKNWMEANGWSRAGYLALERWEQTELRVESKGGLEDVSFMKLWGNAAVDVTKGYGSDIKDAATATGRTIRNTLILGVVGICGVAVIVYRKPLLKLAKAVK